MKQLAAGHWGKRCDLRRLCATISTIPATAKPPPITAPPMKIAFGVPGLGISNSFRANINDKEEAASDDGNAHKKKNYTQPSPLTRRR